MKIAILVGSTRPGRKGSAVGRGCYDGSKQRDDAEFELIEIEDYHLPLLDEAVDAGAANRELRARVDPGVEPEDRRASTASCGSPRSTTTASPPR